MNRRAAQQEHLFVPDWPAAIVQATVLLLTAALTTAAIWALRPDSLPLRAEREFYQLEVPVPVVDITGAMELYEAGDHLFVDIRDDDERRAETIPGAFRIRADRFDDDLYDLGDFVYPEDPIILFGSGDLVGPVHVADLLIARGFEDVRILTGSVAAWRGAGGETSPAEEDGP